MNERGSFVFVSGWAQPAEALLPLSQALAGLGQIELVSVHELIEEISPLIESEGIAFPSAYAVGLRERILGMPSPVTLIGWSMGGLVALETSLICPDAVSRVVLISSLARFRLEARPGVKSEERVLRAMGRDIRSGKEEALRRFYKSVYAAAGGGLDIEQKLRLMCDVSQTKLVHGLSYLLQTDLRSKLDSFSKPVLLVHGAFDNIIPFSSSLEIHRAVKNCELVRLESSEHGMVETAPAQAAAEILRFIEKTK